MSYSNYSAQTMMRRLLNEGWELRIIPRRPRQYAWMLLRGVTTIASTKHEVARDHCVKAAYNHLYNLDEVSA